MFSCKLINSYIEICPVKSTAKNCKSDFAANVSVRRTHNGIWYASKYDRKISFILHLMAREGSSGQYKFLQVQPNHVRIFVSFLAYETMNKVLVNINATLALKWH